ncbi:MAG: hypothetical protein KDB12_16850, partial [Ilumatobacter sp.]|nr:hypothetical protein [Ilumatobacter sp.]
PSPCEGWAARDVVRHLVDWVPGFFGGAGAPLTTGPSVDEDPAGAWRILGDQLQALLDDPVAAARHVTAGPMGEMTLADAIDRLVTGDVHIHTWDVARACRLDKTLDAEVTADMLAGMAPMDAALRASGHFGPKVDVPADAPVQDRLLAFVGRRP